jgi:hypothetical protein
MKTKRLAVSVLAAVSTVMLTQAVTAHEMAPGQSAVLATSQKEISLARVDSVPCLLTANAPCALYGAQAWLNGKQGEVFANALLSGIAIGMGQTFWLNALKHIIPAWGSTQGLQEAGVEFTNGGSVSR